MLPADTLHLAPPQAGLPRMELSIAGPCALHDSGRNWSVLMTRERLGIGQLEVRRVISDLAGGRTPAGPASTAARFAHPGFGTMDTQGRCAWAGGHLRILGALEAAGAA